MKKIVRTLMIIIFILLFALITKASAASTGTITEDTVNVRKEIQNSVMNSVTSFCRIFFINTI